MDATDSGHLDVTFTENIFFSFVFLLPTISTQPTQHVRLTGRLAQTGRTTATAHIPQTSSERTQILVPQADRQFLSVNACIGAQESHRSTKTPQKSEFLDARKVN